PYEEVAYDVYRLEKPVQKLPHGIGRIGVLKEPLTLHHFANSVARALNVSVCRYAGLPDQYIKRVAVVGGSGMAYARAALTANADVFVTGDIKYHEALDVVERGLCLIDAGHDASEIPALKSFAEQLQHVLRDEGKDIEI